jgi:hypothetical protein
MFFLYPVTSSSFCLPLAKAYREVIRKKVLDTAQKRQRLVELTNNKKSKPFDLLF